MSEGLPKLEESLSKRAYAEVGRAKTFWHDYCLPSLLLLLLPAIVSVLMIGVLFVALGMPIALTGVCFHSKCFKEDASFLEQAIRNLELGPLNGYELGLMLQSLMLVGLGALLSANVFEKMWQSRELTKLAYLPIADDIFLRSSVRSSVTRVGAYLAYLSVFGYFYLAWYLGVGRGVMLGAILFGLFQCLTTIATIVLLLGRGRVEFNRAIIVVLCLGLLVGGWSAGMNGADVQRLLVGRHWVGFSLSPPGWINAAFAYGMIEGNPLGWLWLVPALGVIVLAYKRMQTTFAIREFIFHQPDVVEAVPEVSCASFKAERVQFFRERGESFPNEMAIPVAEKIIRAGKFLRLGELDFGWAGRLTGWGLNRHERAVIDCFCSYYPRSTRFWKLFFYCGLGTTALLALPQKVALFLAAPGMIIFLCLQLSPWLLLIYRDQEKSLLLCRWLPTSPGALCHLFSKLQLGITLVMLPLVLVYGAWFAWRIGDSPLHGMLLGAEFEYVVLATHPWGLLLTIPGTIRGTNLFQRLPTLLAIAPFMIASAYALHILMQGPQTLHPIALAVLPLASLSGWYLDYRFAMRPRADWL